jgi:pyrroloquinoline quinone biosynthesis protein A
MNGTGIIHENHEPVLMMSGMSGAKGRSTIHSSQFVTSIGRTDEKLLEGERIMWTKPQATEMRFGFEVTMYVCNR